MVVGFVGGGSGGHFYPLIAVADVLNKSEYQPDLYYFGPSPYDKAVLEQYGITYVKCPAGKLRLYFSIQNFLDAFRNFFGIFIAIWKLYRLYPDVIFSKGGYTSIPILTAAKFLRIPVVIHESDSVPGRSNKIAAKMARYIGIAYDDAAQYFPAEKTALVGIPLRAELKQQYDDPFVVLQIPNDKPLIYVTGGSQGAERINDLILQSLQELLPNYRVFHQVGDANLESVQLTAQGLLSGSGLESNYYVAGHVDAANVSALLQAAALVVTRAGSTTLFEIAYHGKPAIVIPIPEDISRDQRSNAYAYARTGAALVIEEQNLTKHVFAEQLHSLLSNHEKVTAMATAARAVYIADAETKVAGALVSIGLEHGS